MTFIYKCIFCSSGISRSLEGRGCYNMVLKHGYNVEPGWAMLVVVEAKVSERIVIEVDKILVQSQGFKHWA